MPASSIWQIAFLQEIEELKSGVRQLKAHVRALTAGQCTDGLSTNIRPMLALLHVASS